MNIVGLSGKAGSGKDYIADKFFLKLYGYTKFSMAFHFKNWIVGKGLATFEEVFITKPPHIRKLLQEEGTERGRNVYGEKIWIDTTRSWLRCLSELGGCKSFIVPDLRFVNEVNLIKELGGKVYRIEASDRVANNKLTLEQREHISETALDDYTVFDGIIDNRYNARPLECQFAYLGIGYERI